MPSNSHRIGAGSLLIELSAPRVKACLRSDGPYNEQLLLTAPPSEAAGSLSSPAAFFMIAPQQNCGR
jgi:hypothetical protein